MFSEVTNSSYDYDVNGAYIDAIPPLNEGSNCGESPSGIVRDALDGMAAVLSIAQKTRLIVQGITAAANTVLGPVGAVLNGFQLLLSLIPSDPKQNLVNCVLSKVQKNMNNQLHANMMNTVDGFISNFERRVIRQLGKFTSEKTNDKRLSCFNTCINLQKSLHYTISITK